MRPLQPTEEVMLIGLPAQGAHLDGFNPYYGLVVKDLGWGEPNNDPDVWNVVVLWEDGRERTHPRRDLQAWADLQKKLKES